MNLRTLRDRLTPARRRVWYGPVMGQYGWGCNRCAHNPHGREIRGFARSLAEARGRAKRETRTPGHRWMRAVYDDGRRER